MSHDTDTQFKPRHFNFNSLVGIVAVAMVGLAISKIDHNNTATIEQGTTIRIMSEHIRELDSKIDGLVTKSEMEAEFQRWDMAHQELKHELESFKRRFPAPKDQ